MAGPLRLGFAGTPEFAAIILQALIDGGRAPLRVWTQPDRPGRRGRQPQPSPVKRLAQTQQLALTQPPSLGTAAAQEDMAASDLDWLVVAAYGLILPPAVLALPRHGCVNLHASLLPRWRGAAPVERALLAGDAETGVCLMRMAAGLDTGPVYACRSLPIDLHSRGGEVTRRLAELGGALLLEHIDRLHDMTPTPQDDAAASYAAKLTGADATADWQAPASTLIRQINALAERLPVTAQLGEVRVRLLAAEPVTAGLPGGARPGELLQTGAAGLIVAAGSGALKVLTVQLNRGKGRPMDAAAACNGFADLFQAGACFE